MLHLSVLKDLQGGVNISIFCTDGNIADRFDAANKLTLLPPLFYKERGRKGVRKEKPRNFCGAYFF